MGVALVMINNIFCTKPIQQDNLAHLIAGLSNEARISNDLNFSLISFQESVNRICDQIDEDFLNYLTGLNTIQNIEFFKLIWHTILKLKLCY